MPTEEKKVFKDKDGQELAAGDVVTIRAKVKRFDDAGYAIMETLEPLTEGGSPNGITLKPHQVEKAGP